MNIKRNLQQIDSTYIAKQQYFLVTQVNIYVNKQLLYGEKYDRWMNINRNLQKIASTYIVIQQHM